MVVPKGVLSAGFDGGLAGGEGEGYKVGGHGRGEGHGSKYTYKANPQIYEPKVHKKGGVLTVVCVHVVVTLRVPEPV